MKLSLQNVFYIPLYKGVIMLLNDASSEKKLSDVDGMVQVE